MSSLAYCEVRAPAPSARHSPPAYTAFDATLCEITASPQEVESERLLVLVTQVGHRKDVYN